MARKKNKEELTRGELSKEFFGDGSAATPGQEQSSQAPSEGVEGGGAHSLFGEAKSPVDLGPDYTRRSWFELGGGDNPEVNPYAAEQDKRYAFDPRAVKVVRLAVLIVLAFVVFVAVLPSPAYNIHFAYTFSAFITCIQENVAAAFAALGGGGGGALPYKACTYGIILCAGIALATTGAVYQGALKNALASPTTLGINAGGTLGVSLFVILAPLTVLAPLTGEETMTYLNMQTVIDYYHSLSLGEFLLVTEGRTFASVLGCFVAAGLVMLVAQLVGRGRSSSFALIICGQVVATVASSVVEAIRYYVVETEGADSVRGAYVSAAQSGSISSVNTPLDLLLVAVPIALGVGVVIALRRKLNILAFKDEEARSMGIATQGLRWVMVGVCTFITAITVSFCGNVAFVGFAIPLIMRRYVGPDFNYLIPASALAGGLFLVVMYWFTSLNILVAFGIDFPISMNLITSVIGAVMFVAVTLGQRRASRSADWI